MTPDYTIIPEHIFREHIWPHFHHRFQIEVHKYIGRYVICYHHYQIWSVFIVIGQLENKYELAYIRYVCCFYNLKLVSRTDNVRRYYIGVNGQKPPREIIRCMKSLWHVIDKLLKQFQPDRIREQLDSIILKPLTKCDNRPIRRIKVDGLQELFDNK